MTEKMPEKNHEDSIEKETVYCKKLIETIKAEPVIAERPLKEGCYKGGKTKIYVLRIKNGVRAEHEEFMKTDEFKTKAKERYKIEAKNSELKNQHGYRKAVGGGIHNMELQSAFTVFAVNLKRIFKFMDEK